MMAANAKSCKSNEASLKRNSDHLDAGTSSDLTDSADRVIGDEDHVSDPSLVATDAKHVVTADSLVSEPALVSEPIDFTVVFMKEKYEMSLPSNHTVADLKKLLRESNPVTDLKLKLNYLQRRKWEFQSRHRSSCLRVCPDPK